MTTDCTPRYCYADPYEGGKQAVAEAYRNLCAVGARPLAITNCLNFANPQRPEIMAQFVGCLEGMGDACRALDFPIVSGNVSLYNESKATGGGSAILPTPAIGGVGILEDYSKMMTMGFKNEGDAIWLIGGSDKIGSHLGQSLYAKATLSKAEGAAPPVDLALERRVADFVRDQITRAKISAAHDVSDGGALVAIAEMALTGNRGCWFDCMGSDSDGPVAATLFGEDQNRIIITTLETENIRAEAEAAGLNAIRIGTVQGSDIAVSLMGDTTIPLTDLREAHESFFRDWMEG
jgi:phosphoribosylformylglycinamidine (FGAM) synthase-like enzyme